MDGHEVTTPDGGKEKTMTLRISYAQERGKKRLLSSRTGRREAQMTIEMRKAQMGMRDMRNVAMTMDEMPRRWKALADQVPAPSGSLLLLFALAPALALSLSRALVRYCSLALALSLSRSLALSLSRSCAL
eukprot:2964314-Rhodomonas_salina.2